MNTANGAGATPSATVGREPAVPADRLWRAPGSRTLLALIGSILVIRLLTLGAYPLMDTSEARYGEIARVMLTTGNLVTPQEVPGTPFWAKPPLYSWLSAASMRALGVNEFALRLPSFLCALGVLALCYCWSDSLALGRPRLERARAAALTLALLSTSLLFFVSAGAVMTDPGLALCSTWMLAAFHHAGIRASRAPIWRYGFFVAAGLGMLAKGPVILLYAGVPIALWTLWQRRVASVWTAMPWVVGTVLAGLICVPWYLLAEQRTPGFLRYFLLGEHVMRFLKPGWGGDLYGTAHAEPLGMIWLYLAGAMGASAWLVVAAVLSSARNRLRPGSDAGAIDPEHRFLLLATLTPLVFFSFAGNIIWTYVLPVLGPLAVLVADFFAPRIERAAHWRYAVYGTLGVAGTLLALAVVTWAPRHVAKHSSASLVAQWRLQERMAPGALVYLGRKAPASLRFYSRGSVRAVPELAVALQELAGEHDLYLALAPVRTDEVQRFAAALPSPLIVQQLGANSDLALLWVHDGGRGR